MELVFLKSEQKNWWRNSYKQKENVEVFFRFAVYANEDLTTI